ncbi:hypothetical protein [Chitinibacter sp. S2-10]|uniref:hypothetical protein n=1 Tax=Chitinibacter sp. S2-10 TaxID=3373597 RepID=UPI003977D9F1
MIKVAMFQPEFSLPVSIPLRFFRTAPLWLALAALLALTLNEGEWQQRFAPAMLAITHLLMLGFVGNIMLGALLQVSAVLAGVRISYAGAMALWLALQSGTASLAFGLWQMQPALLGLAAAFLLSGLAGLAIWLLIAFWRGGTRTPLRWAVIGLLLTVISGALLLALLGFGWASLPLNDLLRAHIVLGSMAWVVGLIIAVAFTVVPMFLVAPAWPPRLHQSLSMMLFVLVIATIVDARWLALLAIPLLIWLGALLKLLAKSQRRADPARYLWAWGGCNLLIPVLLMPWLDLLPAAAPILLAGHFLFAGVMPILTAMLAKIIPFLLWMDFRLQVKSGGGLRHMGQLFPERWLRSLSHLIISMGIAFWPLYLFAFKAIPILLLIYSMAITYCLMRSIRTQRQAIQSAEQNHSVQNHPAR